MAGVMHTASTCSPPPRTPVVLTGRGNDRFAARFTYIVPRVVAVLPRLFKAEGAAWNYDDATHTWRRHFARFTVLLLLLQEEQ